MTAFCRSVALLTLAIGTSVIVGYIRHIDSLIVVRAGLQGMSPLTAAALCCLAGSLAADSWNERKSGQTLSAIALLIGIAVLFIYSLWRADVASPWIAAHLFGLDPAHAGRTSIATAACITALASATFVRGRPHTTDALAGIALFVSGLALVGYVYGVRDLYSIALFESMAIHTAIGIFGLSLALILAQPGISWGALIRARDSVGRATRRQLLFTATPALIGWVLLQVVQLGQMGIAAAFAVLIVLTTVPLALLILRDSQMLARLEQERTRHLLIQRSVQKDLQNRLETQARELTTQALERARTEAVLYRTQRLEAVGQLTGSIAHDFNNLLMAISGNLEIASRVLPEEQRARAHLDKAKRAVTEGAKLTKKLLAFSRLQDLHVRAVELDPVLDNARSLIGNALGPKIDIQMKLQTAGLWTSTDPDQLELAILNLALNARDAMSEGGLLTISTRRGASQQNANRTVIQETGLGYVSIIVADTGTGMSAQTAARATEPFFTTKETGRGTGLGLAQVDGLLRQCRGHLRILSQLGKGTSVELLLPLTAAIDTASDIGSGEDAGAIARRGSKAHRGVVLVIDDEDDVRHVIVEALRNAGHEVCEASDGQEGLDLLTRIVPQLAIVDFIMPGLNGAQVALRAQQLIPDLPIIFVSGYFDTAALRSVPGAAILRKPFNISELQQAVSTVLH